MSANIKSVKGSIVDQFPEVAGIVGRLHADIKKAYDEGHDHAVPGIWASVEIPASLGADARASLDAYLTVGARAALTSTSVLGG